MKTILALLAAMISFGRRNWTLPHLPQSSRSQRLGAAVSFTTSAYCYLAFTMTCRVPCVTSASLMKRWWLK